MGVGGGGGLNNLSLDNHSSMTSGLVHLYHLDVTISSFGVFWWIFFVFTEICIEIPVS